MRKATIDKIRACKALRGKTILDVVELPRFVDNLAAYWKAQEEDRDTLYKWFETMRNVAKGYRVPAHVIDDLLELTTEELALEFASVLTKASQRPFAQRQYIRQIGMQAYNLTVIQYVCDEYPELEKELLGGLKDAQN